MAAAGAVTQAPRLAPAPTGLVLTCCSTSTASTGTAPRPANCRRSQRPPFNAEGKAWLPVLHDRRVVRGREAECRDRYAAH